MHRRDFIPDVLQLPDDTNNIFLKHIDEKDYLMKLIQYPWYQNNVNVNVSVGGGIKRRKKKLVAREIINKVFCDLWREQGFKSMKAFGIKKGRKYHWTVTFHEKGRFIPSQLYDAFVFTTDIGDDHEKVLMDFVVDNY